MSPDAAAVKIQAVVRGYLWRLAVKKFAKEELQFIGMSHKVISHIEYADYVALKVFPRSCISG